MKNELNDKNVIKVQQKECRTGFTRRANCVERLLSRMESVSKQSRDIEERVRDL